jgi:hypothetical protein
VEVNARTLPTNLRIARKSEYRNIVGPWGFDILCTYEWFPGEPAVLWGDAPYPGAPAECNLLTATVGDIDVTEMLNDDQIGRLSQLLLEEHDDE